jgi:uncharacterized membrane protein YjjB (DUF3815 family)
VVGLAVTIEGRLLLWAGARRLFEPVAAVTASALATAAAVWIVPLEPTVTVLGGLAVLLPGFAVTVALEELAARHLMAGTARLMGALTSFLLLGLGVALVTTMVGLLGVAARPAATATFPLWIDAAAAVLGLFAFGIWFRAPPRDLAWVVVLGTGAELIERTTAVPLGLPVAAALAAGALALTANPFARLTRRSAAIPLAPALMLLVPGSIGLRTVVSLTERNILSGVETAYQTALVAIALTTGLLVGNLLLPSRDPGDGRVAPAP